MKALLRRYAIAATSGRTTEDCVASALPLAAAAAAVRPSVAGVLVACVSGIQVVTGPLVGARLDRSPHRRALLAVAPVAFAAPLAGVFALLGHVPSAWLIPLCVLAGSAGPLLLGGLSAALIDSSDRPLPATLRADATSFNLAAIAGPLLAAALVSVSAPSVGLALLALALVSATTIVRLPFAPAAPADPAAAPRATSPADRSAARPADPSAAPSGEPGITPIAVGPLAAAAPLWRSRPLRAATVASTLGFVAIGGLPLVLVARGDALASPSLAGVALAIAAAAALVAALLPVDERTAGRRIATALAAEAAGLAIVAAAPTAPALLAGMVVVGAGSGALLPAVLAVRAANSRPSERSAVFGTAASLKIAASALGAALTGAALDATASTTVLLVLVAIQLAAIALHAVIAASSQ